MQGPVLNAAAKGYSELKQPAFCTFRSFGLGCKFFTSSNALRHCGKINS